MAFLPCLFFRALPPPWCSTSGSCFLIPVSPWGPREPQSTSVYSCWTKPAQTFPCASKIPYCKFHCIISRCKPMAFQLSKLMHPTEGGGFIRNKDLYIQKWKEWNPTLSHLICFWLALLASHATSLSTPALCTHPFELDYLSFLKTLHLALSSTLFKKINFTV